MIIVNLQYDYFINKVNNLSFTRSDKETEGAQLRFIIEKKQRISLVYSIPIALNIQNEK
jgi:hypothetical protein